MVNMHNIRYLYLFIHTFAKKSFSIVFVVISFETYAREYLINVVAHGKARG